MSRLLEVHLGGTQVATLEERSGKLRLQYLESYVDRVGAVALSRSLPLRTEPVAPSLALNWLNNLLPDNLAVRDRWAREYQVSANSPFALLRHVGRDCAGAVTFVDPEALAVPPAKVRISSGGLQQRLATIAADGAAWDGGVSAGQFSLAGAQSKFALRQIGKTWFETFGSEPTSHIVKPSMPGFPHQNINEHLTMSLAKAVGFPTANTEVAVWKEHPVLIVERFDRVQVGDQLLRVHQEDFCQALGLSPDKKYQINGGPGVKKILKEIQSLVTADEFARLRDAFLLRVAFNWLVGGTDAHAKNFSWFIGSRDTRLTPMYDLNSLLVYIESPEFNVRSQSWAQTRMAMSVGGESRLRHIGRAEWQKCAREVAVDAEHLVNRVADLAVQISELVDDVVEAAKLYDGTTEFAQAWADSVASHARRCLRSLNA